jgi:hypothetical protein
MGNAITMLQTFLSIFPKTANRSNVMVAHANKSTNIGQTFVAPSVSDKMLNLAQMQEQLLNLTVLGDPVLEAGRTINCTIPKVTADTSDSGLDPVASGRWLISKVEHSIREPQVKPRYVCNLECLKGAYQE